MSPTVFRFKNYRFFFFSREEKRKHVHVYSTEGEAKYWIEPNIEIAESTGLSEIQLRELERIIEKHIQEINDAWYKHFGS